MKKCLLFLALGGILIFTGCQKSEDQKIGESNSSVVIKENSSAVNVSVASPCKEEKVEIQGYGEKGKRLKSCFVEYPGEPSRQDKSYYVLEDTCGQFTKEFMENMLGTKLNRMELPKNSSIFNCTYYLNEKEYIMLNLEYLSAAIQKKGNEEMGRKVEKEAKIPMENLVVYQEDGPINVIYLVLGPEKFISMRPSSKVAISNEKFIELASRIGMEIEKYK